MRPARLSPAPWLVVACVLAALVVALVLARAERGPGGARTAPATASTLATPTSATTSTTLVATTPTIVGTGVPPDMLNPAVSRATLGSTICVPGYTATIRPPTSLTSRLKIHQLTTYGYSDQSPADYEEDHAIALELGGAPAAPANLWPEPRSAAGIDDRLENDLHARVCAGSLDLATAQARLLEAKVDHGYRRQASTA